MGDLANAIAAELETASVSTKFTSAVQVRSNSAVTATTGGGTTGLIPAGASFVTVTSDSADKQISLPAASVGDAMEISIGSTGCELISAVAAHKVNNVTVGATNELALAANCTYYCKYFAENNWRVVGWSNVGAALGPTTAALTTITIADAEGTPDYAIAGLTQTTPWGWPSLQEAVSFHYAFKNLQERVSQMETAAKLIPDAL